MSEKLRDAALEAYRAMHELDDQDKVDEALKMAHRALAIYKRLGDHENQADVFVFLGDFDAAEGCYEAALRKKQHDRAQYYQRNPEEAYRYGSGYLDSDIRWLKDRIAYVSGKFRGSRTPPYRRTMKRKDRDAISLVAFDLDGTLTDSKTDAWTMLYEKFGLTDKAKELAKRYHNNEISFTDWVSDAMQLLARHGIKKQMLRDAFAPVRIAPYASWVLRELKEHGMYVTLLSGSFDMIVQRLFGPDPDRPGEPDFEVFHSKIINSIDFTEDGRISGWSATHYGDGKYKAEGLNELAYKFGVRLKECAFVGNGLNDVEAAKIAGLSIAINSPPEELRKASKVVIEGNDLREILPHITRWGYGSQAIG